LNKLRILFRVDANGVLGLGHLMRCLVLAETFRSRGHSCAFLTLNSDVDLLSILKRKGFKQQDLISQSSFGNKICLEKNGEFEELNYSCVKYGLEYSPHILVVDHYWIDHEWESNFKNRGIKILVLDDLAASRHNCDFLVHQTNIKSKRAYLSLTPPEARILAGFEYMILRAELRVQRTSIQNLPLNAKNILVAFGFTDPNNLTSRIGRLLSSMEFDTEKRITILAGKSSILRMVEQNLSSQPKNEVILLSMNSSLDIIKLLKQTDYAVTAGGLLSIELAYLGIPCTVIPSSKIQYDVAQSLALQVNNNVIRESFVEDDLVQHLHASLVQQKNNRKRIFHPDFDGLGSQRIVEAVLT